MSDRVLLMSKKFKNWESEQAAFLASVGNSLRDSKRFAGSIFNSVRKESFFKSRPKQIVKSLAGAVLCRQSVSESTRKNMAYFDANQALLSIKSRLKRADLNLSWDDESIVNWAESAASRVAKLIAGEEKYFDVRSSRKFIYAKKIRCVGVYRGSVLRIEKKAAEMAELKKFVNQYGFNFPLNEKKITDESIRACLLRLQDAKWWRRKARVAKAREIDQIAREFRVVHARGQVYASNELVDIRRKQSRRNRLTLEGFEAVNQLGEAYTLQQLSDLSVSNPVVRRSELMTRISGFEKLADYFGHEGIFITMSAPSRFHPMKQIKNARGKLIRVDDNKNFGDGEVRFSPRDAQAWLNKTWAMIRAEMARQGICVYGFRVVEPHHDGCPHWHQLLFVKPCDSKKIELIFKRYCMRSDAFERGAGNRLKIIVIDKKIGSASGYISKYICKSIDGSHIDSDLFGNGAVDAAERIRAWASGHGIRQFQQIGGAGVTVWRELRRMQSLDCDEDAEMSEDSALIESAREAADAADWAAYNLIQGGGMMFFGRDDQLIRPARWLEHDAQTGEVIDESLNCYGERSSGRVFGVVAVEFGINFVTRLYRWTVGRIGDGAKKIAEKSVAFFEMSEDELLDYARGSGEAGFTIA